MSSEDFWMPEAGQEPSADLDLDKLNFYMKPSDDNSSRQETVSGSHEEQQPAGKSREKDSMDWELDRLKALLDETPEPAQPEKPDLPPLEEEKKREKLQLFQDPAPELAQAKEKKTKTPREKKPQAEDGLSPQERRMKYVALGFAGLALLSVLAAAITVAVFYFRAGL